MMNSNSEDLKLEFSEGQQAENTPRASLSFVKQNYFYIIWLSNARIFYLFLLP